MQASRAEVLPIGAISDLKHAHHGYTYQDLLGAIEAVDLILGQAERVWCDTRLCGEHDKFDDLTVETADGRRRRRQIKHQSEPRPLDVDTFARPGRKLLLSEVFRGIRADELAHPERAEQTSYTVYLRDTDAVDKVLTTILVPSVPDPGPSVSGSHTTRYRFDAKALWEGVHRPAAGRRPAEDAWEFIRTTHAQDPGSATREGDAVDADRLVFTREEVEHLCTRLIVEVGAPAMSSAFAQPGPLEQLLLRRLRAEVGVGDYPNENRRSEDVAALLVAAAANARQTHAPLTRPELLRTLALQTNYGTVSRRSPVVAEHQVSRAEAVAILRQAIERAAVDGGFVTAEAPPGQGKSWVADQLRSSLVQAGWTVAEHYCFLNDSEEERDDRVASERIFGSLTERVAAEHPDLASQQRPILSADESTLMRLVAKVTQSGGPVALIIDGIDHVTRVRGSRPGAVSASEALAAQIAALETMPSCVVVVLSQPGDHLAPLVAAGATAVEVPSMDRDEIAGLARRLGLVSRCEGEEGDSTATGSMLVSEDEQEHTLDSIFVRSGGNPLYATYLCRELGRSDRAALDPVGGSASEILATIPAYDGDLEHYYSHLAALLDDSGQAAADTLTVVDFPLTEGELKEIQPGQAHRISKALRVLEPVLRTSPRGVSIYHESFARYLRRELDDEPEALAARVEAVVAWLGSLGLFRDARAFGSMLPLMASVERNADVVGIVDRSFAAAAVGAGYPPSAIRSNLGIAVRCAQREGDWPAVVRYVELMRGVETYEQERLANLDLRFVDVRLALFGTDHVVDRMLRDGLVLLPPEAGLLLCAELDRAGVVVPWRPYLDAWRDHREGNDREPEPEIVRSLMRGQMRLITTGTTSVPAEAEEAVSGPAEQPLPVQVGEKGAPERVEVGSQPSAGTVAAAQIDPEVDDSAETAAKTDESALDRLLAMCVAWCDRTRTLDRYRVLVEAMADLLDHGAIETVASQVEAKGAFMLAVAEELSQRGPGAEVAPYGSASDWAEQAATVGAPVGQLHRLRALGVDIATATDVAGQAQALQAALDATSAVLGRHSPAGVEVLLDAIQDCRDRPIALDAIISALDGEGWFRCWLRFCVDLVRAEESASKDASARAMHALRHLAEDDRPFVGSPRAVDLSQEMNLIWDTVARAVRLLDRDDWPKAIALLLEVGRSVTGSLDGEMGVPLPPDRALRLGLETLPEEHIDFLVEQIGSEIEISGARFYSDISEFHLLEVMCHLRRAAIAEARGDAGLAEEAHERATRAWASASSILLAYGWHKDITVFEVLDPLKSLTTLDSTRGLQRMVVAHDMAYRAWRHSDGRETRHAPVSWWEMLAAADPVAHAELSLSEGLSSRGERTRWEQMRQDLWTEHAEAADPVLSAVLAHTLPDAPLKTIYPDVLRRLVAHAVDADLEARKDELLQRSLTRADEVAVASGHEGQSSQMDQIVAAVNAIAADHGLRSTGRSTTMAAHQGSGHSENPISSELAREDEAEVRTALEEAIALGQSAPSGAAGIAVLTRAWRRSGVSAGRLAARGEVIETYAQALVVRLEAMIDGQREGEVAAVLESLSELSSLNEPHLLLARIGELLVDPGAGAEGSPDVLSARRDAAARALALAWTQARGDRGWLAFGGHDYMDLLKRASGIAPGAAAEAVGSAVERRLTGLQTQTMGITKALIEAFAAGALGEKGDESLDAAFGVWDEAFAVIADRLPQLPGEEDGDSYDGVRHEPPEAELTVDAVDFAFALSTFAGLSHPGRENLRRTVLALGDMARMRPQVFALALPFALRSTTGAFVPLLLLTILDEVAADDPSVLSAAAGELAGLLGSDFLAVRALSHRLLHAAGRKDLPHPISDPTGHPEPLQSGDGARERLVRAARLLQAAPYRPAVVDERMEGFIEAVVELIARDLDDGQFRTALHEAGRDMGGREWPDAAMLGDHVAEEALQRAAGALRAHLASQGTLVTGAVKWEDDLAELIKLTPLPSMIERGRIPRPDLALPPKGDDPQSAPDAQQGDDSSGAAAFVAESVVWTQASAGKGGPYDGWVLLAYEESRRSEPIRRLSEPDVRGRVEAGVELVGETGTEPEENGPLGGITVGQWFWPDPDCESDVGAGPCPLAALARPVGPFADDRARLGLPGILAPSRELVHALALSGALLGSDAHLVMSDEEGPALAHVVWRSSYSHSDYHLQYPRLEGSALLLRPDLAQLLVELWGERLRWRTWVDPQATVLPGG